MTKPNLVYRKQPHTITIDKLIWEKITIISESQKRSRSSLINYILSMWIEEYEEQNK